MRMARSDDIIRESRLTSCELALAVASRLTASPLDTGRVMAGYGLAEAFLLGGDPGDLPDMRLRRRIIRQCLDNVLRMGLGGPAGFPHDSLERFLDSAREYYARLAGPPDPDDGDLVLASAPAGDAGGGDLTLDRLTIVRPDPAWRRARQILIGLGPDGCTAARLAVAVRLGDGQVDRWLELDEQAGLVTRQPGADGQDRWRWAGGEENA